MKNVLSLKHVDAWLDKKQILFDINISIKSGEIHALMGPNGSGKSTLTMAAGGHPSYKVKSQKSKVEINEEEITNLAPEERVKKGLFITFQQPVAIPGVNVVNLLRLATFNNKAKCPTGKWLKPDKNQENFAQYYARIKKNAENLAIPSNFLTRSLNDDFSGGEKKKTETLQALMLEPKFAIFDEIDTGLDVDALKIVANSIAQLAANGTGVIIITHYPRLLKYLKPHKIHVLLAGKIVKTGNYSLLREIDKTGYEHLL